MIPLGIISIIIQAITVIHIIRTKRDQYWLYIVIFLPTVGAIAYFVVEILPGLFHSPQTSTVVKKISRFMNPEKEIKEREARLAFSDTFDNRKALADCYFSYERYEQAVQTYRSCLQGMHQDDPYISEGLAKAYYHNGNYAEAKDLILKLQTMRKPVLSPATQLLLAFAYEQMGEPVEAEKVYQVLVKSYPGEEARYRYAQLLTKSGKNNEADKILNEILTLAQHSPKFYVRDQRQWIDLAKRDLEARQKTDNA